MSPFSTERIRSRSAVRSSASPGHAHRRSGPARPGRPARRSDLWRPRRRTRAPSCADVRLNPAVCGRDVIVKEGTGWRLTVDPEQVDAHGLLDAEIARLNELRVSTQGARLDADLASGRDSDLVGEIEALMIEHPYQERFRAQHMLALYRAGRQREALRSFETLRKLLVEEIGADPSPELRELERRILDQDPHLALRPATSIRRRSVLVADSGDPLELAKLPAHERDATTQRCAELIRASAEDIAEGDMHIAGNAIFPVLPNRLVYPERIPTEHHAACLYHEGEFAARLRWAITHRAEIRRVADALAPKMLEFDWSVQAPLLDDQLAG